MTADLLFGFMFLAPFYFLVVWCGFGVWTWYQRQRFWRQIGRR